MLRLLGDEAFLAVTVKSEQLRWAEGGITGGKVPGPERPPRIISGFPPEIDGVIKVAELQQGGVSRHCRKQQVSAGFCRTEDSLLSGSIAHKLC